MANTGYQITPTLIQKFLDGPESGSIVTGSFGKYESQLGVAPFSASLEDTNYYYRALNEITCPEGFEDCQVPILTSVQTGSAKGLFNLNYTSSATLNPAVNITGSISQLDDFSVVQTFSASIGTVLPISSSFTSGTVYFRAFQSCSGPDKSPFSDPLEFTFAPIPPPKPPGSATFTIQNTLNTPISYIIQNIGGNLEVNLAAKSTRSHVIDNNAVYSVYFRGGSNTTYGNTIIKSITSDGGASFNDIHTRSPNQQSEFLLTPGGSITFYDSKATVVMTKVNNIPTGGSVNVRLTFASNTPPAPVVAPAPPTPSNPVPYTPRPTIRFGGSAFSTADSACNSTDFRSQTYYQLGNYLYLTDNDAIAGNRPSFPNERNYILTNTAQHAVISKNGYIIESSNTCSYPTLTISNDSFSDQEAACRVRRFSTQTVQYKGSQLIGKKLNGRFKMQTGRGGQNVIISNGQIISYETCGTEGSSVTYTRASASVSGATSPDNPYWSNFWCKYATFRTYFVGPSGTTYYSSSGKYAYIPLGLGSRIHFDSNKNGYIFFKGQITGTYNLSC